MTIVSGMKIVRDAAGRGVAQVENGLEWLYGRVAFNVAAGPSLPANTKRRMFVDNVGSGSSATVGGLALVDGDANFGGGRMPANIQAQLLGMACRMHISDFSAVLTDAQTQIMAENTRVNLIIGAQNFDLGLLSTWLGPYGSPTGLNNVVAPRKFGLPWGESEGPIVPPGAEWSLDFVTQRAITTVLTASKDIVISAALPAYVKRQAEQAVRIG